MYSIAVGCQKYFCYFICVIVGLTIVYLLLSISILIHSILLLGRLASRLVANKNFIDYCVLATSTTDSCEVTTGSANWFPESEFYDESCGYAVGGSASDCVGYDADPVGELSYYVGTGCMDNCPYNVDEVASCQSDYCDMCGQQLPPPSEEERRNQHLQVDKLNITTLYFD